MMRPTLASMVVAAVAAASLPSAARAQGASSPPASTSRLQIQQVQSGMVIAPDVRFTDVNGRQATLAGGYLGWLTDKRLLVGAAGYVLANRNDDFQVQYGGGLARWTFFADKPVALSTGVFAGFGTATLSRPYGDIFGTPRNNTRIRFGGATGVSTITTSTPVRVHDDFSVAEPQANLVWTITPWLTLDAGAGYRFVGASDLLGRQLRGVSGSIALRFGT